MRSLGLLLLLAGCAAREPGLFDRAMAEHPEAFKGARQITGQLRLRCSQQDAEVFIDQVLQGRCDDFNGEAGRVALAEGAHLVEVKKPGFVPYRAEVLAGDARTSLTVNLAPMN